MSFGIWIFFKAEILCFRFFNQDFFLQDAHPDIYTVRRIHEIQAYLKGVEELVLEMKTELDLTRNLLYKAWLKHPKNCKIATDIETMPVGIEFLTKSVDSRNTLLMVQDTDGSTYERISTQITELGFNSGRKKQEQTLQINTSRVAYEYIKPILSDLPYECFYLILLNASNRLIKAVCASEGGVSGTLVDPKKVFKIALDNHTTGMLLAHNHPSGNLRPSSGDERLTKRIIDAGRLLDINIIDHIIIGVGGYFSFADEGMM